MIGAKLDGEAQRKKLISTRHPKQAATQSFFALAKARRRKSSSERRRRRRISITAGEESEANGTCGSNASLYDVLEEGEHKQTVQIFHMFALFEDDITISLWTAGFAAFGSSTSGYGYSPPSATLRQATKSSAAMLCRDDNQLKMCLLCTCKSSVK